MARHALKHAPWNKGKTHRTWGSVSAHTRRVNPVRRRRRRSNPTHVLLANPGRPHKRRRRRVRRGAIHHVARRSNPTPLHRKRRRSVHNVMRSHRIKRRSNPFRLQLKTPQGIVGMLAFAGAGVMAARAIAYGYSRFVAGWVLGVPKDFTGPVDQKSWRAILNEVLRLVAMGLGSYALERAMQKAGVSEAHRQAFLAGGWGETGRQTFSIAWRRLVPSVNPGTVGLDGPPAGYRDEQGTVWVLRNGQYFPIVDEDPALEGVDEASAWDGVDEASAWDGVDEASAFAGPSF